MPNAAAHCCRRFDITNHSAVVKDRFPLHELRYWGGQSPLLPVYIHDGYDENVVVSVRCATLERFLMRTAFLAGTAFRYNSTVTNVTCGTSGAKCVPHEILQVNRRYATFGRTLNIHSVTLGSSHVFIDEYDALVIADGAGSAVMAMVDIGTKTQVRKAFCNDG